MQGSSVRKDSLKWKQTVKRNHLVVRPSFAAPVAVLQGRRSSARSRERKSHVAPQRSAGVAIFRMPRTLGA
ncbi:hypothetical protein D3C86_1638750 [compost metagenome]